MTTRLLDPASRLRRLLSTPRLGKPRRWENPDLGYPRSRRGPQTRLHIPWIPTAAHLRAALVWEAIRIRWTNYPVQQVPVTPRDEQALTRAAAVWG
jgi:hypothetical protein